MFIVGPPINDITTDFTNPPAFIEIAKQNPAQNYLYPKAFQSFQEKDYPEIKPVKSEMDGDKIFEVVLRLAKDQKDWSIVSADRTINRVEAVATTLLIRYKDDVVIEIRPVGGGSEVHMRSKSRTGKYDLGTNSKRIKNFLKLVKDLL